MSAEPSIQSLITSDYYNMSSAISDESICQSKTNSEAGLSISQLSSRGQERVDRLGSFASPKSNAILSEFKLFDAEKNPDGLINLGTAENSLLSERLLKVYKTCFPAFQLSSY